MRNSTHALMVAVLSIGSSIAIAAPQRVNPEKLPKVECSSLQYSEEFLAKYPKAPAACLEAREYKGHTYMKVKGKVYIAGEDSMTITFQNVAGDPLDTMTLKDSTSRRVLVNGRETAFTELRSDEVLTFWIPESMFSAASGGT